MLSSAGVTGARERPSSSARKTRCLSSFPVASRIGLALGMSISTSVPMRKRLKDTGDGSSGGAVSPLEFQRQGPEFELLAHQLV